MQVDPNYISGLSSAISISSATEQALTSELSSGLRVATLSDDPVAVSSNVQLSSGLANLDAFVQSASGEESRLQAADSTLGEVVSQVTSAISLATQGANGTLNASDLASIAQQVSAIRDSVVSLANTSYQGTYLFSGSQGGTKPFTVDSTTTPATTTYAGDNVTSTVQTPGGQALAVNVPGSAVFTATGSNLLGTLNQLVSDLQSGSTASVAADSSALTAALVTVSAQQSTIDSSLSQLTTSSGYAQSQSAVLEAQQTTLLSADTATVATSLQTAEVQHQALISVVSALGQNDLFSYLK